MQNYNFNSKIVTGSGTLYECTDNGASVRPDIYDPEILYLYNYRVSIIDSISITNNNTTPIKVKLSLTDDVGAILGNITVDVEIPAGDTFIPVGESNKLFLEHGQRVDVLYSSVVNDSLVVATISVMNMYDYGHIPPIYLPALFYGQTGFMTGGETFSDNIDKILFSNDTVIAGSALTYSGAGKASGSDIVTGIIAGAYAYTSTIASLLFSSFSVNNSWGTLYQGTGYFAGSSDAIICLFHGGYNNINIVQYNEFASGGAGSWWSSLLYNSGRRYTITVNNLNYSVMLGGTGVSPTYLTQMQYNDFKSQGQAQFWGNLFNGSLYRGAGCSNNIMGIATGDGYQAFLHVHKVMFDSQTDSTYFGDMITLGALYECGSVGNDIKGLFGADERYGNTLYEIYYDAEYTSTFWGNISNFDGGNPTGCSGD